MKIAPPTRVIGARAASGLEVAWFGWLVEVSHRGGRLGANRDCRAATLRPHVSDIERHWEGFCWLASRFVLSRLVSDSGSQALGNYWGAHGYENLERTIIQRVEANKRNLESAEQLVPLRCSRCG
jgi:hypothetical protein